MASRAIRSIVRPISATLRPVTAVRAVAVAGVQPVRTMALTPRVVFNQEHESNNGDASPFPNARWFGGALAVAGGLAIITKLHDVITHADAKAAPAAAKPVDYAAVRKAIVDLLDVEGYDDGSRGPLLVRLAWHAAGTYDKVSKTGGSDGATMRFPGESGHGANAGLLIARDALEVVKKQFPNISYADLWTLAGSVAIEEMGGPSIAWRAGRADATGPASPVPDGRLPDAAQGAQHVRDIFYRMGFNDQEIVALLGAHSLGRCHEDRSGFKGPWTRAPTTFSNEFYRVLLEETWTENKTYTKARQYQDKSGDLMMLPADLALVQDPAFKKYVELYAKDEKLFFKDFAAAWIKLLELGCNNLVAAPALPPKA
jgi:cytochrome c peroxidase